MAEIRKYLFLRMWFNLSNHMAVDSILRNYAEDEETDKEIGKQYFFKDWLGGREFCNYIIIESAMGTEIGAQQMKNVDYVDAVRRICELIWQHERLPWLWLNPIWYGSGAGFEFDRHLQLVTGFTRKVLNRKFEVFGI